MTVTAPIDVDTQHEDTFSSDDTASASDDSARDDLVILDQPVAAQVVSLDAVTHRDPAMVLVYVGILSLIAIIAVSAFLAL